jgi:hypothetical protein
MKIDVYEVGIMFTESVLGTQPNRETSEAYIQGKAIEEGWIPGPKQDELDALPSEEDQTDEEKGVTVFYKIDNGDGTMTPVLFDYQFLGFLKNAGKVLNGIRDVKNLHSKVTDRVFVFPRHSPFIIDDNPIILPGDATDAKAKEKISNGMKGLPILARPLRRDQGLSGPRTAIAKSEEIAPGAKVFFEVHILHGQITFEVLKELLTYGHFKGLGQWRNGSHGRFLHRCKLVEKERESYTEGDEF